jgi:uncharacterized protein YndB with AHSA1/START domain
MELQWSRFKLRVNIRAGIDTIYQALGTPAGLESWFLKKATITDSAGKERQDTSAIQAGDSYEWFWYCWPGSHKGKILSANGKDIFKFTFSMNSPVTISIYPEAGETIVELVESDLPTDPESVMKHYVGDSKGWIFYLTNLKALLESGIDLRNKNEEIKDVITA